ncbi:hypothetical protein CcaverHIS002_0407120 [Cutaneotrichosporon cavernicola]|uniref:Holocytochrome c-type synthase n=1 Tax=Cutaneotrichosporon cavernicola TaxID=279322 RepID=A0AA48L4P1_9TREE|nr:uncharacterized protein CcaverHIS019_0407150 [Cutaneotrichosporon cavernicola]BEI84108.1 hypothetical protein CcaverHIS002_0407120 [Cutaneotrichosporon cavernicola]BEI91895.1 hypothetical protein CcaverHIS019_0407150 [Cutaneotrichosporon cavernicola]BEI99666.1 hypothetical protein CcaverHIS631_0407090 [Cutaneotrichosporon cavernicola]BEJ07440.1 hypothetical protein CcaverHIS641_0407090 [Cutaneotrichosporon cavernicola]
MRFFSTETQEPPATPTPKAAASTSQLPPDHPPVPEGATCPVDESARATWLQVSEAEAASHPLKAASSSQARTGRLSHEREVSSIPRAASATYAFPEEQAAKPVAGEETGNWVYPSEQQFFNAMMRKNHNPKAGDMRTIVPIHNAVNEKAWEEVLMWEAGKGGDRCGGARLSSFVGRPKERSPKAWVKTMFGYTAPFDRHDWIVDRCGKPIRYVIDFYTGKPNPAAPDMPTFYLDVRPALDDWEHVKTRMSRLFQ